MAELAKPNIEEVRVGPTAERASGLYFATGADDLAIPAGPRSRTSYGFILFDSSFQYALCCRQRFSPRFRNLLYIMKGRSSQQELTNALALLTPRELIIVENQHLFVEAVTSIYVGKAKENTYGRADGALIERKHSDIIQTICQRYREVYQLIQSMHRTTVHTSDDERAWGPPKGGALPLPMVETCLEAAARETKEETWLEPSDYAYIQNIPPFVYSYYATPEFVSDSRKEDAAAAAATTATAAAAGQGRPRAYIFNMVLFIGMLKPDALKKIRSNMGSIIADNEIDNVDLFPVAGLEPYLPIEYAKALADAVKSLSERIRSLKLAQ